MYNRKMKTILAILLVVAVAGFVECMPKLSDTVRNRLANLPDKRGESSEEADEGDWPYGWMEYTAFVGKCVSVDNYMEAFKKEPTTNDDFFFKDACHKAYAIGEMYTKATKEEREVFKKFINDIFALLQCLNLAAERRGVELSLNAVRKSADCHAYMVETEPLQNKCVDVFGHFEGVVETFIDGMKKGKELLSGEDEDNTLQTELRRLLMLASRHFNSART